MKAISIFAAILALMTTAASADSCLLNWDKQNLSYEAEHGTASGLDDAVVYSVDPSSQPCGGQTSFLDTYDLQRNVIEVKVGGKTLSLVPLALYRKNRPHKCNTIKVRNACYDRKDNPDGSVELTLSDPDRRSKKPVTFKITKRGHIVEGIFPEFALVSARFGNKNKLNMPARIAERIGKFRKQAKSCKFSPKSRICRNALEAVAESTMLERLRFERFKTVLSTRDLNADWEKFRAKFSALSGPARAVQMVMELNEGGGEKGKRSPYQVSDATIERSALSLGVRQLDIGGNREAQKIFVADIRDIEGDPGWDKIKGGKRFVLSRRFMRPIREFAPEELYMMHKSVDLIMKGVRGDPAVDRYNLHHAKFLEDESKRYEALRKQCLFKDSPALALMVIDRSNQRPADYQPMVAKVAELCRQGASVEEAERELATFYGQYADRAKKVHLVVEREKLQ